MIYFENGVFRSSKYQGITFSLNRQIGNKDLEATLDILYREFPSDTIDFLPSHNGDEDESFIVFPSQKIDCSECEKTNQLVTCEIECGYRFKDLRHVYLEYLVDYCYQVRYFFQPSIEIYCASDNCFASPHIDDVEVKVEGLEVVYNFMTPQCDLQFQFAKGVVNLAQLNSTGYINSHALTPTI